MSADSLVQISPTHTPDNREITEVTVGVLVQPDGQFLLAQRPEGKSYMSYWGFPGGKLEAGELVETALTRKLKEGPNVTLRTCVPWHTIEHDYMYAYVRLYFCKVTVWDGMLRALGGQNFVWQMLSIGIDLVLLVTLSVLERMCEEVMVS